MKNTGLIGAMRVVLADTYALYLKTQNYHWHVKGPNFKSLHVLFEEQYQNLANAVDTIAERILAMGERAPATFKEFMELKTIQEGDSHLPAEAMVKALEKDQTELVATLKKALTLAQETGDEGTVSLLGERIADHEKVRWMLASSL